MRSYYKALHTASADVLAVVVDALRLSLGMRSADMHDIIKAAETALNMDAEELEGIVLAPPLSADTEAMIRAAARDFCRTYKKENGS